ncbi:hypothetical protein ACMAUO_07610 [Gluconacetobacter sp. Hr-1-5]|uniref:hypothetical protein n=1 Tax=Gluconacetobacter sp. Hr-1-5 TaxID=3395370 RepID=UPI003B527AE0
MRRVLLAGALALLGLAPQPGRAADRSLPVVYEAGHVYAVPTLANGRRMRMLIDTGGGTFPSAWISNIEAGRLGLKGDGRCASTFGPVVVARAAFQPGKGWPLPGAGCDGIVLYPGEAGDGQVTPMVLKPGIWTFDYGARSVTLRARDAVPEAGATVAALGFKRLGPGRTGAWPRIRITVDGQVLDMLLDTGATSHPTAEALTASGASVRDGVGVASYITASTMAAWHARHPEWRYIAQGDDLFPKRVASVIEVPEIGIAGQKVGPVWFTQRPDAAFHGMMAQLMDLSPEGAVGGNVFENFRMTIDYPHARAWFFCETARCRP